MALDRKDDKQKLQSRLNAIKGYLESKQQKVKQDMNNVGNNFFDKAQASTFLLASKGGEATKKIGKLNIFDELTEFLSTSIQNDNKKMDNNPKKIHLRRAALEALQQTTHKIPEIVRDEFMRGLYVSTQLGCGVDSVVTLNTIRIRPQEFDLLEMLKIDPTSLMGGVLYEKDNLPTSAFPYPANKLFYVSFDGNLRVMNSKSGNMMFSIRWDAATGEYVIGNMLNRNVYNFVIDYFSSVEIFERKDFYGMLMALIAGTISVEKTTTFYENLNGISRLVSKILGHCPSKPLSHQNDLTTDNVKEFDDLPYEVQDLFDFDDTEGVFGEEEDRRRNRVLLFTDCGNMELPVNERRIQEFFQDFDRNSGGEDYVNDFINDMAYDTYQKTKGNIPMELIKIDWNKNFLRNIPKALAMMVLTPKVLFPFVLLRRLFGEVQKDGKELLKAIHKIIFRIIRRIFETFMTEFFKIVKKELLRLINTILADSMSELKVKRTGIIKSLLEAFRQLSMMNKDDLSCGGIFRTMLQLLSTSVKLPFTIPTPLLLAAEQRSGFSNIRAFINVVEELDRVGIPTGDLYGHPNKHVLQHLAHIKGVERERSENGVVRSTVTVGTVPTPAGPGVVVPGTFKIVGIIG